MKAIRLNTSSSEFKPLEVFIKNLNCQTNINLYKYNNLVYIDPVFLLKPLNVTTENFKKSAKSPQHYILIKGDVMVSRYGLF